MIGRYRTTRPVVELNRRNFLAALSVATLGAVGLSRCAADGSPQVTGVAAEVAKPSGASPVGLLPPPPDSARVALPGGVLSRLPGEGDLLALTVDDGVSSEVVRAYTQFAKDTGARMTFFVNGIYRSWTDHIDVLRPLVDAGQIQLANHTWSHPNLTKLPLADVAEEFRHNHEFLWKTYGIDARPYFRPPYGAHNAHVEKVAGELGYTANTLWSGTLEDHVWIPAADVVAMADRYFTAQTIVIGHLNHEPVTEVYGQLVDIIRARRLRTVTLNDVFVRP
ncbi:Peptidoglycan/xylan/chitin deacetylase, PgdA/CDA1 family [Mycolicibacterium rutilum]|uniref:Peptidoglycan/xylan/chitin deacetylase, PgdA/CDA1 family n=1 Tax=Mycolicibacterium rutilum TaxID=370526 RepID=A0A1H6JCY8_MYCRU|nr:polysaccharide deacetylase family protein [Mycolicibacterium rutilum]SEH56939.1 Peptidoglycan/xylan/chitin deacetylase, PgdA/CDA1 family [Mycolicibacterium rutilum]